MFKMYFVIYVGLIENPSSLLEVYMKIFFFATNSKTCVGLFFCTGRHHPSFNQAQKNCLFFPRFIVIWYLHSFLQSAKTGEIVCWDLLHRSFWKDENKWGLVMTPWEFMHLFNHRHVSRNTYVRAVEGTYQTERKNCDFPISHLFP